MANEFKHKDPCTTLTQAEYIAACGDGHIFACQATGDIVYASSATVLSKLGKGAAGTILNMGGSCIPAWTATPTIGSTSWCNAGHAHAASNSGGTVCANVLAGTTLKSCVVSSSLTSVGTLGALTVDDVAINGKVVTMTGSACDTIVMTAATNGAFSLVTTDTAGADGNIVITADGTVDVNSAGLLTLDSGAAINIEPAACSAILLDGTISIDAGVVTGATSITSTAIELGHASDTTITRASSGDLNIECNIIYRAGGTDVPVADGGTGASTFTANGILVGNGTSAVAVTATMATKGHLMVGDGSGVPSMLAVGGTCDHVLTVDSSEATGVKWAAAGGIDATNASVAKIWAFYEQCGTHSFPSCITYNMTSITDGGAAGDSDLTIATDFSSAVWVGVAGTGFAGTFNALAPTSARAAGTFTTQAYNHAGCATDIDAYIVGYGAQ